MLRFVSELALSVAGGRKLDRFRPAKKEVIMMERIFLLVLFLTTAAASTTWAATPAPSGAELYFISPKNGEVVSNPVVVRFGLKGMGVAPAGVQAPNTGHHHLLINTAYSTFDKPIPKDDRHVHFGDGQTETTLTLAPGKHTLQLLLGDYLHVAHQPPVVSKVITISVR
jgi:hypothetical protein